MQTPPRGRHNLLPIESRQKRTWIGQLLFNRKSAAHICQYIVKAGNGATPNPTSAVCGISASDRCRLSAALLMGSIYLFRR
ncbi:hypothetical protein FA13DRAFT_1326705 [Coprinellus micaceus]|uniref:Uncharacterized protein n=1 Tax=Coprinellus micaceus TaxID=71717 RepID=A0A4Y7SR66_COPMI|nr:hypothetical protein FA13DRAFT_1326705 [Coprinellus micaceus]